MHILIGLAILILLIPAFFDKDNGWVFFGIFYYFAGPILLIVNPILAVILTIIMMAIVIVHFNRHP